MKPATIVELKRELKEMPAPELMELCLRMAKFKKDNKELLTYLIFESGDEAGYIQSIKDEMETEFQGVKRYSMYFAKKALRKILRNVKKQIRYSGDKRTEAECLLHFCRMLKKFNIPYKDYTALLNMYDAQIKRVRTIIKTLHEDLQYDYTQQINAL